MELASIAEGLRAYLSWQSELGATGVPRDPEFAQRLRQQPSIGQGPRDVQPERSQAQERAPQQDRAVHQERALQQGRPPQQDRQTPPRTERQAEPGALAPLAESPPAATKDTKGAPEEERESFAPLSMEPSKKLRSSLRAPKSLPLAAVDRGDTSDLGQSLEDVANLVRSCTQCDLHAERTQTVFSRGTGSSGLCFVGEGPGADEDAQGEPFVGAAGQLLDKMIGAMGLHRDEVYVCNVVKCRPPGNRRPTPVEMQTCSPYLRRQLELLNPQVIVALGGTAVTGLLGLTDGITRLRGRFRLYEGKIAVMPTFHPAYLLRNPSAKREVWADLRQVLTHMGRELPPK